MSIRQLGIITMVVALLILLSSASRVGATPPEPTVQPAATTHEPDSEQEINNLLFLSAPLSPGANPIQTTAPAITNNPIQLMATSGHWVGTTSQARLMSFDVLSSGNQWDNFKIQAPIFGCSQYNAIEYTLTGPGSITNNQFSGSNSARTFSFSGQFTSGSAANGTYSFVNYPIPSCSNFTQSGTWTANSPCTDTFEPDNSFSSAKSITVNGTAQTHNFHIPGDEDWVSFNMTTGTSYVIATSNLGVANDTYLYLYDTNGATILTQNDDGGSEPLASQIVWTASASGLYYARVRHFSSGAGGCSGYNYNLRVTSGNPPTLPSNLTAAPFSATQINLAWNDNSLNESGFQIERSPNGTTLWTPIATVGANVTTYTNIGLTCGTAYFYRVRAYNTFGNSAYSNTANATTLPCSEPTSIPTPTPPSNLTATPFSATQINLTWQDNSNNEIGFKIERSPNGTTGWVQIATVGANITIYSDTGLTCGTAYFYRVQAYNTAGNSMYSNNANATTSGCNSSTVYLPFIIKTPTCATGPNQPPEFPNPFSTQTSTQFQYDSSGRLIGAVTTITIPAASDPNCDPLAYSWSATNGSINGSGTTAVWNRVIEFGRVKAGDVTVVVSDGKGGTDSALLRFQ